MSASKDAARPSSQRRPSSSSVRPNFPNRPSMRPHAHTVSLGSLNAHHRVNRRKSSTSMTGTNRAALAAAIQEGSQGGLSEGRPASHHGLGISNAFGSSLPRQSPDLGCSTSSASRKNASVLVDGPPLSSSKSLSKARARRASEGSVLKKERRNTNVGEVKCETCGKGYKHGSCLKKHLWEHTPEWALTSKLLISKHAQVQMLEAAAVLLDMTKEPDNSDTSSQSPAASGSSNVIDEDDSSSRTSTPSQDDEYTASKPTAFRHPRRQDSESSVFSRSFGPTAASSLPAQNAFHQRWNSGSSRPTTATSQTYAEEQADITAAAEGLVGVSIGTPQFRASQLPSDVPPVPPLPAKFASQAAYSPYLRAQYTPDAEMSDDDRRYRTHAIAEDEDEGMFGSMEQ